MRTDVQRRGILCCISILLTLFMTCTAGYGANEIPIGLQSDPSLKKEVNHAIDKGLQWLERQQNAQGWWSQPEHPALTGLVLESFMGQPGGEYRAQWPSFIDKGYAYLLQCRQPDGGIYVKDLANYNTSVSLMALVLANKPENTEYIRAARNYIVGLQDPDTPETGDMAGGVGYGGRYKHSDLSNTTFALESLYYSRYLLSDMTKTTNTKELNWDAALKFVQRCQNLPGSNDLDWASDDPANKGGFVYFPGNSKAEEMQLPDGKVAIRSYGSISYAGLLSFIYADLEKNDPRVLAAYDWLVNNYTLEENPGMGPQGLFYYYHMMAKALAIYGVDELTLSNGKRVNWRKDLALRLLNLQSADGSWVNENGRWWEKDPVLVTSYALLSLEILVRGL